MKGSNMCLAFNLEVIYDNANFVINDNDKVGIVGVNGAGKTTLFNVILKKCDLDSGNIFIKNKNIGYLPQQIELKDSNETVLDYLLEARPIAKLEKEINDLYEKINNLTDINKQNRLLKEASKKQEILDYYEPYQAESELFNIIEKMDINAELLDMPLLQLSGGQKSKIAFAHLLYEKAEIILLDEPTNHLDEKTKSFVTEYLKNYPGMVLIISHDYQFLDEITDKTLYIDKMTHQITVYSGNYSIFKKKYDKQKELHEKLVQKQEKEINKLRDIVLLYSNSSGKRKRMAQSREKTLVKKLATQEHSIETYQQVKITIKPKTVGDKIPLRVNNLYFSYDSKSLINNLSFIINRHERFLICGENGVGKSTLLKLIINKLTPKSGQILLGKRTDIAYYAQEQEQLDNNLSILDNVKSEEYSEKELRTVLGSFLFKDDDVYKKVGVLSPGERARVALCKIVLKKANLLILDEPTNHLDSETQMIIGQNFKNYEGTIILVSHNVNFVKNIGIDRMLILPSGKIQNFDEQILKHYQQLNYDNTK